MGNFFDLSDFALFAQYANKKQQEASDGQAKLRQVYDKLGLIINGVKGMGYHASINKNPLQQAGPGAFKYAPYHWSRVYPKEQNLFNECNDKVFVVVGTTVDGFNIHIDSYQSKGFTGNNASEAIKKITWFTIPPEEATTYTCEQLVKMVDDYFKKHWLDFNRFAKEFDIQGSIRILNKIDIERFNKLLLSNYNVILTGAPGTGKTFLAKEIAKSMGAEWKLVQFHPSYDYTDFVEGLRPVRDNSSLGFQRKDGFFKSFCKEALASIDSTSFEELYNSLVTDIINGSITTYETLTGIVYPLKVVNGIIKYGYQNNGEQYKSENVDNIKLIFNYFITHPDGIVYSFDGLRGLIKKLTNGQISTVDPSEYSWTIKELLHRRANKMKKYVLIIDEINRGEISKIFGELFYSIDPGYRGTAGMVTTQYQNLVSDDDVFYKGFYVPENVYIIGTMNDIDRSVESMDFAMRRRFAWTEITAESRQSMLDDEKAWGVYGKPEQSVIDEIKVRMNNLNACIIDKYGDEDLSPKDKIGLTKAYQIGASYFLKYGMYGNFKELWDNHFEGLLYEYLRGANNIEAKINRLHSAYNDTTKH